MISNDEYSKLLDQQFETKTIISANKIISGTILKINDQHVTVDIGYKSEGQIPRAEFLNTGSSDDLKTGQKIEVFVEKLEDREGNIKISHEKAIKMKSWEKLQKLYDNKERVKGFIVGKAKAGLYVKIMGTNAFLPLSQIDVRPVRDVSHLIKTEETFEILKMDYSKGNIVVSRKAILEEKQKEIKNEIVSKSKSDSVINGRVKTFTDYGAFVDLGGITFVCGDTTGLSAKINNSKARAAFSLSIVMGRDFIVLIRNNFAGRSILLSASSMDSSIKNPSLPRAEKRGFIAA